MKVFWLRVPYEGYCKGLRLRKCRASDFGLEGHPRGFRLVQACG